MKRSSETVTSVEGLGFAEGDVIELHAPRSWWRRALRLPAKRQRRIIVDATGSTALITSPLQAWVSKWRTHIATWRALRPLNPSDKEPDDG